MTLPRFSLRALFAFMTIMCVVYAFPQVMVYVFIAACITAAVVIATLGAMAVVLTVFVLPVWIAVDTIKQFRESPPIRAVSPK